MGLHRQPFVRDLLECVQEDGEAVLHNRDDLSWRATAAEAQTAQAEEGQASRRRIATQPRWWKQWQKQWRIE